MLGNPNSITENQAAPHYNDLITRVVAVIYFEAMQGRDIHK